MTLLEKIAAIRDEASFNKDSKIETRNGSYDIWTEASVLKTLRPLFAKHRVLPVRQGIEIGYSDAKTIKLIVFMVMYDLDSDQTIPFTGVGTGFDPSDKDSGKASTYATKDAFLKLFTAVSGMDSDLDSSDKTDGAVRGTGKALLDELYRNGYFHQKAARELGTDMSQDNWATAPGIEKKAKIHYQNRLVEIEEKPLGFVGNLCDTMRQLLKK